MRFVLQCITHSKDEKRQGNNTGESFHVPDIPAALNSRSHPARMQVAAIIISKI